VYRAEAEGWAARPQLEHRQPRLARRRHHCAAVAPALRRNGRSRLEPGPLPAPVHHHARRLGRYRPRIAGGRPRARRRSDVGPRRLQSPFQAGRGRLGMRWVRPKGGTVDQVRVAFAPMDHEARRDPGR